MGKIKKSQRKRPRNMRGRAKRREPRKKKVVRMDELGLALRRDGLHGYLEHI